MPRILPSIIKPSDLRPLEQRPPTPPLAATGATQLSRSLQRFESLGDNCEFGFVQRAYQGSTQAAFFAGASPNSPSLIPRRFRQTFAMYFNIRTSVPYTTEMVRDTGSDICFHSQMKSNGITGFPRR